MTDSGNIAADVDIDIAVGLVGYGKGGRYFHAPLVAAAPGCRLAGVVTRSPARRAEVAADHPDAVLHDDLAGLIAAGVDVVVVSTPLDAHAELVRQALTLGVPVVCDKPFAPDAATARALVQQAEAAGVLLSVYQNRRWDADFRTTAAAVASGRLGEVVTLEAAMEEPAPDSRFSTATGGGVLLDFGSHLVDQARHLLGPVTSVFCHSRVRPGDAAPVDPTGPDHGRSFDDRFLAVLRHAGGATSHLVGDWALQGAPVPRFRVLGTHGTFVAGPDDGQARHLLAGRSVADVGPGWGGAAPQHRGRLFRGGVEEDVVQHRGDWTAFYALLARAVRGEGPVPVDPWDSVAALEVLDAARRSAVTGEVVHLPDGPTPG